MKPIGVLRDISSTDPLQLALLSNYRQRKKAHSKKRTGNACNLNQVLCSPPDKERQQIA